MDYTESAPPSRDPANAQIPAYEPAAQTPDGLHLLALRILEALFRNSDKGFFVSFVLRGVKVGRRGRAGGPMGFD